MGDSRNAPGKLLKTPYPVADEVTSLKFPRFLLCKSETRHLVCYFFDGLLEVCLAAGVQATSKGLVIPRPGFCITWV